MRRTSIRPALIILVTTLFLSGCQFGLTPETEDTDVTEFVNLFDTSYELELQGSLNPAASVASSGLFSSGGGLSSSATVPGDALSTAISAPGNGSVENYPEPGLKTDFSITATTDPDSGDPLFRVVSTTTAMSGYEDSFLPNRTNEIYYVSDDNANGDWDEAEAGSVVHFGGTSAAIDLGTLYREEFADYFSDGSVRDQLIINASTADGGSGPKYAAFDINGSMDFPTAVLTDDGYTPASDGSAVFSSQVIYVHPLEQTLNFWFLNDAITNPTIVGVRYYTEHTNSGGQTVGTSYALEIVYGTINSVEQSIAQTVIRKEVVFGASSSTAVSRQARMQMVIENQVAGENMVVGKNGKDISRLPPKAQEAQLRNILRDAESSTGATWNDLNTVWDEVNIQL